MGVLRQFTSRFLLTLTRSQLTYSQLTAQGAAALCFSGGNELGTDEDDLSPLVSSQLYVDRLPCGMPRPSISNSRIHQHYCAEDESDIAVLKSDSVIGE